jgi:hypothetical protein
MLILKFEKIKNHGFCVQIHYIFTEAFLLYQKNFFFFFFKGRKKDFRKVMGIFLRIIGPLAEAI